MGINLLDTTSGAGDSGKAGGDKLNAMMADLYSRYRPRGGLTFRKRISGVTSQSNNSSAQTQHLTTNVPVEYDAIQLIVHMNQATLPAGFTASVSPSAKGLGAVNPVDGSNAALTPIAVTFGSTDPFNPRNPNGGVSPFNPTASKFTTPDAQQGEVDLYSDIIPVRALPRTDAGTGFVIMVRLQATNNVPTGNVFYGNDATNNEPDFASGTVAGDQTLTASGVALSNPGYMPPVTIVCYSRGKRVLSIVGVGDSTFQGSNNSGATTPPAADGTANQNNGFGRQLTALLNAAGTPASFEQLTVHGNQSWNFHEQLITALLGGAHGMDIAMFEMWSTNEGTLNNATNLALAQKAMKRTLQIIDLCHKQGVRPIVMRGMSGWTTAYPAFGLDTFFDRLTASGIITYDPRPITGVSATGEPAAQAQYQLHDSTGALLSAGGNTDGHPNNAVHAAIAADMFAKRIQLGLV